MSETKQTEIVNGLNARIRTMGSSGKGKRDTAPAPVVATRDLPQMQTQMFSAKGKVEGEQSGATEGEYVIEVRILARRYSGESQDPLVDGFRGRLEREVKRQLNAMAGRYRLSA